MSITKGDTKYTSNDKKVLVLDLLNDSQVIVQEIFIINNEEKPIGKRFMVDIRDFREENRLMTWKVSSMRELEELKKKFVEKKEYYREITKSLYTAFRLIQQKVDDKQKHIQKFLDNVALESFDTLCSFLKGEFKYLVTDNHTLTIEEYSENSPPLNLLSLYGSSDGSLTWKINRYRDGSGHYSNIYPCKTYEEAKTKFKELAKSKNFSSTLVQTAKKHDIELDKDKLSKYTKNCKEIYLKEIGVLKLRIEVLEKRTSTE